MRKKAKKRKKLSLKLKIIHLSFGIVKNFINFAVRKLNKIY